MSNSNAQFRAWNIQLIDSQRKKPIDDDSAQMIVMTAGSPTAPTIYSDGYSGSTVSNAIRTPRTSVNGWFKFWTAKSVTSVDISVLTSTGEAFFYQDVSYNVGRLEINPVQLDYTLVVPFGASDNTEVDTGFDLPSGLLVKDAYIKVTTTDSGETLDAGLLSSESGGDADGFVLLTSVATSGYVNPWPVVTGGTNIDYLVHTAGYGALLKQGIAGADAVATVGGFARRYHATDGVAESITYTGSSGSDTAAGYICLTFQKLP